MKKIKLTKESLEAIKEMKKLGFKVRRIK